jgi:hypothetical protein
VRNYDVEAAIAFDHPNFKDKSVVTYSWAGLRFPVCGASVEPDELD